MRFKVHILAFITEQTGNERDGGWHVITVHGQTQTRDVTVTVKQYHLKSQGHQDAPIFGF